MAGVIGSSGGGYATVNPTQGNPLGEALQNVENSAFGYRAERREEDQMRAQQAKAQKDALDAETKDMLDYASKHKITPTTMDSLNKSQMDLALVTKNSYSKLKTVLNNSNDREERNKAMEGINNLETTWEAFKVLPDYLNTTAKDLEEGIKAGKYNPASSIEAAKTTSAMATGQMKFVVGEDMVPRIITYERKPNGELSSIIDKEYTIDQIKQKLTPIMAFDSNANALEFKKSLGDKVKTDVGNKIIEGYPGLAESAEKNANSVITNRDKMYGVAADAGVQPKFDLSEYTTDEVAKVKNYIVQSLTEKYKDSVTDNDAKLSREQAARNQAESIAVSRGNLAIAQQKASREEEEKNTVTVGTTEYKFTDIGTKAKKDFYAKPENKGKNMTGEDWPAGSFKIIRTSEKVVSGGKSKPKTKEAPKPSSSYTNVTETDKGTIGVKNGKWYYTKTGKLAQ
jgi:hypothetical protein